MSLYRDFEVLTWHQDYLNLEVTAKSISAKYKVKHETMLRGFRRLGLTLRPSGFRVNNCKGRPGDNLRLCYIWLYKFNYLRRAQRKNLEFTLTEDQFIQLVTSDCYYCGKSWKTETRCVAKKPIHALTVDRVDSKRGYTLDNCVSSCKTCNTIKMDIPFLTWLAHIKNIFERHSNKINELAPLDKA